MRIVLPFPDTTFLTIYADPPWPEYGGGKRGGRRGANRHYNLMTVNQIADMGGEVRRISALDSHLYLWVTNTYLESGLRVMTEWGFKYVTTVTWVKDRMGLGQYFRGMTEHCLFGRRGVLPYKTELGKRSQGQTAIQAPRSTHSTKPEEMRKMIERVSYEPYVELFARRLSSGWSVWPQVEVEQVN